MEIRMAADKDIPDLLRLLGQVGDVHHRIRPDIFPQGTIKYDAPALAQLLPDADRPVFVAEAEGVVVGYCFCKHKRFCAGDASVARQELYIDDLCVDETCRRMGVARALYQRAVAHGRALGCETLTLNVWCGNDGAMGFYEEMGLRPRNVMMEVPLEEPEC